MIGDPPPTDFDQLLVKSAARGYLYAGSAFSAQQPRAIKCELQKEKGGRKLLAKQSTSAISDMFSFR